MAISESIPSPRTVPITDRLVEVARESIQNISNEVDRFVLWEREHVLKKDPTPEEKQEHQSSLKLLLRTMRLFQVAFGDPDYPDHSMKDLIEVQLRVLEQSWRMVCEPMPEAEAEKLLAEVFPNGPRA